jgi:SHAQKYF class myb-like DNA-binding protein
MKARGAVPAELATGMHVETAAAAAAAAPVAPVLHVAHDAALSPLIQLASGAAARGSEPSGGAHDDGGAPKVVKARASAPSRRQTEVPECQTEHGQAYSPYAATRASSLFTWTPPTLLPPTTGSGSRETQPLRAQRSQGARFFSTEGAVTDSPSASFLCPPARVPQTRKPYTITKQRERWTEEEHSRFLEALKLHGRAWRKIEGSARQPYRQTVRLTFVLTHARPPPPRLPTARRARGHQDRGPDQEPRAEVLHESGEAAGRQRRRRRWCAWCSANRHRHPSRRSRRNREHLHPTTASETQAECAAAAQSARRSD